MRHQQYLDQVGAFLTAHQDPLLWTSLDVHAKELLILMDLDLDPALETLDKLYCPVKRAPQMKKKMAHKAAMSVST